MTEKLIEKWANEKELWDEDRGNFQDGIRKALEYVMERAEERMKERMQETFIAIYGDYISKDDLESIIAEVV